MNAVNFLVVQTTIFFEDSVLAYDKMESTDLVPIL